MVLVLVLVPWNIPVELEVAGGVGVLRRKPRSGGAARGGGECGEEEKALVGLVTVDVVCLQRREQLVLRQKCSTVQYRGGGKQLREQTGSQGTKI